MSEAILQGTRTLLKTLLSLSDDQVVPAREEGPRPDLPYLTVLVIAPDVPVGSSERRHAIDVDDFPTEQIWGQRQATVQIDGFGDGALDWLEDFEQELERESSGDLMETVGLSLVSLGGVQNLTRVLDTDWEPRFLREYEAHYERLTDPATQVECQEVFVEATFDEDGAGLNEITETITVDLS